MRNIGRPSGPNTSPKTWQSPIRRRGKSASLLSLNKNYARRIDTLFKKAYEASEAIADDSTRHQCRIAVIQELDGNRSVFLSHEDDAWPPSRATLYQDFDFKFSTDFMTLSKVQRRSVVAPNDDASDEDHSSPHDTQCSSAQITAIREQEEEGLDEAFVTDNEVITGPPSSPRLGQACDFDMDTSLGRPSTLLPPSPTPVARSAHKPTDAQGTHLSAPEITGMPWGNSEQATLDSVTNRVPPCPTSWLIPPSAPAGLDEQTQSGLGSAQAVIDTSAHTSVLPSTEQNSVGSTPGSDHTSSMLSSSTNDLQPLLDACRPHEVGSESFDVLSTPPSTRASFLTPPSSTRRISSNASSRSTKSHDTDQLVRPRSARRARSSAGLMERLNGSMKASLASCSGGFSRTYATSSQYSGSRRSRR